MIEEHSVFSCRLSESESQSFWDEDYLLGWPFILVEVVYF